MKRFVILGLVAVLLGVAVMVPGDVRAQEPVADTPAPFAPARGWGHGPGQCGRDGRAQFAEREHERWRELRVIADTLGMSQQALIAELRAGKTVAQIASEQGVELSTVVDALVAIRAERLQRAVDNGRLTQEQADALLALARVRVEDRLQQPYPLSPLMIAAQVLDMDLQDLVAELRAGKSVAQVAEERGVPLEDVVDAIVERKASRLNELVAAGRLTQEQADILLDLERERVTRMLNWHKPPPRRGPGHGGGR